MDDKEVKLRRYYLPSLRSEGWGIFVIGSDGYFSAVSDYGNYAFRWNSIGCDDFRTFLIGLEPGYLMSKLSCSHDWPYDSDATLKSVKREILEIRRQWQEHHARSVGFGKDEVGSPEWARAEWDLLEEHSELDSTFNFHMWLADTTLEEAWNNIEHSPPSDLVAFTTKLWKRFSDVLRSELAIKCDAEGCTKPPTQVCRCNRCDREPDHENKYHCCDDKDHIRAVEEIHRRVRDREVELYWWGEDMIRTESSKHAQGFPS